MRPADCPREQDVLDALASGRLPGRCDPELETHAATCPLCADLVVVVRSITAAHDATWASVQVPAAGVVWWRAQLRARREAARAASRPIAIVQSVAAVAALAGLAALAYLGSPWLTQLRSALPVTLPSRSWAALAQLPAVDELGIWWWIAIASCTMWAVVAPLIIYLTAAED